VRKTLCLIVGRHNKQTKLRMKKAIIIGATSGIGKGLAKLLADNNYKIGLRKKLSNSEMFIDEAIEIARNIQYYWDSSDLEAKLKLQKTVFPKGLS
jgi:short-subunit dehydrogenase